MSSAHTLGADLPAQPDESCCDCNRHTTNGGGPDGATPAGPVTRPADTQPDVDYSAMCAGNALYLTAADPAVSESWLIR